MATELVPVTCPRCGERQNQLLGGFHPDIRARGSVVCMACRYQFDETEYRTGLEAARREIEQRLSERTGRRT